MKSKFSKLIEILTKDILNTTKFMKMTTNLCSRKRCAHMVIFQICFILNLTLRM